MTQLRFALSSPAAMIARVAVITLALIATATAVHAQTVASKVVLRAAVTVAGPIVHLGDLADGAGAHADVQLFRAPAPGMSGTVQASRIVNAIRRAGIETVETAGITQVLVTRAGRQISNAEIIRAIAEELVHRGHARDAARLEIRLDSGIRGFVVEQDAQGPVRVMSIQAEPRARRFAARVIIDGSATAARGIQITGYAEEVADVPTLSRPLQRGEQISPADIIVERVPVSLMAPDAMVSSDAVIGMAARRSLRAGQPLRSSDVMAPIMVRRDDMVAIVFERPGLMLSVRGRAIANGAKGEVIAVTNLQSGRILQAEISGAGTVAVRSGTARIAAVN